jgi:hypothetical protein
MATTRKAVISDRLYNEWKDIVVSLMYKGNYSAKQIAEFFSDSRLVSTINKVALRYRTENPKCPIVKEKLKRDRRARATMRKTIQRDRLDKIHRKKLMPLSIEQAAVQFGLDPEVILTGLINLLESDIAITDQHALNVYLNDLEQLELGLN